MSRLYLVILLLFLASFGNAQDLLKKYLDFAEEQYNKGDYYYAIEYYEKAMQLDSAKVDIVWKYAETLRAYKDYRKAEYYYAKVYDKEAAQIYPSSLLNLGLMQKQNGKYEDALETFKKAKKKYYKDKKGYLYQKSKREIESTLWAINNVIDTLDLNVEKLPKTINTPNAEFGHTIHDSVFYFSSLRADSVSAAEEVYGTNYHTQPYSSKINTESFEEAVRIDELVNENMHAGNGSFSLDGNRFYFSQCSDDGYNYRCKIMVAHFDGEHWRYVDSLGTIINEPGSNTTMPSIAYFDGKETLFFASDREDSEGGMDLFYSSIKNGNQFGKVRAIKTLNTIDNEITPWWDSINQRLYFSSSWHDGFGGYDIFYSEFNQKFLPPVNCGQPINSSANDLYYFKYADTSFVSSNRIGVYYSKNPTCCSDIFSMKPPIQIIPPTPEETLADLNKRLPVRLYFHNDRPNEDSWSTTTEMNYIETYNRYTAMIETYKKEYSKGLSGTKAEEAKEDIETFFIEHVDQGVADLELFRDLLLKELDAGAKIRITIKGFASPLAKTDYNVNLTKRRIHSLKNYLREFEGGVFVKYMNKTSPNGGYVEFSEVPFGEYTANQLTSDNPNDVQNSVYSRAAAIERKIEIQSVTYVVDEEKLPVNIPEEIIDLGSSKPGDIKKATFTMLNKSDKILEIESIVTDCDCLIAEPATLTIQAGEEIDINATLNTTSLNGFNVKGIVIKLKGIDETIHLYLSTEVIN